MDKEIIGIKNVCMTKLDWNKFKPRWGTWAPQMEPFFDRGGMDPIYAHLKAQSDRGKQIAPVSKNTFRCFTETPAEKLKVAIFGMCPYHSIIDSQVVADGLCMGCSTTKVLQPSLQKFYEGLEHELYNGLCLLCYWSPSVSYLAEQGVLMANVALTTEIGQPGAHQELWEDFTKMLICDIIIPTGVPIVLLGKDAQKFSGCVPASYPLFELYHPAYAAYMSTKDKPVVWETKGTFSSINRLLTDAGKDEIMWLQTRLHELDD